MADALISASFLPDGSLTAAAPNGGIARVEMIEHTARFERRLWPVTDTVWCMVGNGLSNQTFVEGPGGLIVIESSASDGAGVISIVSPASVAEIGCSNVSVGGMKPSVNGACSSLRKARPIPHPTSASGPSLGSSIPN